MVSKARKVYHTGSRSSQREQGFTLPLWALGIIGAIFVAVAVFAGVVLFQVVEDFVATAPFSVVPEPISPGEVADGVNPAIPSEEGEENPGVIPEEIGPPLTGILPTDRITFLVLGVDQPCSLVDEPHRSDTMILVTVDPLGKTAGLLSIPRDLWVPIPGFGNDRINTAFYTGEIRDYPGGGAALAVETVELNLGIHVQHFVTVNYDAFIQAIDVIGGIELDVPETINDPDYPDRCYGYDPFYLPAGNHLLDGNTALKYARTRATFGADFDRAGRQQAVMMAVLDRMLQQNFGLFAQAPELWTAFEHNVTTDMTYQEALGMAWLATDIPRENVHLAVIDHNYVIGQTLMDGAQVLVPIREKIRELRDAFFSPPVATETEIDLAAQMRAEEAAILVLNGTWTPGLAGETVQYLESLGFTIAGLGDAQDKNQETTQIIDYGGKTATVNFLAELLQVSAGSMFGGTDPDGEYDIELVLGTDWQVPDN